MTVRSILSSIHFFGKEWITPAITFRAKLAPFAGRKSHSIPFFLRQTLLGNSGERPHHPQAPILQDENAIVVAVVGEELRKGRTSVEARTIFFKLERHLFLLLLFE